MIRFQNFLESLGQPPGVLAKLRALKQFGKDVERPMFWLLDGDDLRKAFKSWRAFIGDKYDQIQAGMAQFGFHHIGAGIYGRVYGHVDYPYVIKIFRDEDDGYKRWLKYCTQNKENPYVPKIKGMMLDTPGLHVIRLERLTAVSQAAWERFSKLYDEWENAGSSGDANFDSIMAYISRHNDLHTGNVMMRGNQLVITDPLAG